MSVELAKCSVFRKLLLKLPVVRTFLEDMEKEWKLVIVERVELRSLES